MSLKKLVEKSKSNLLFSATKASYSDICLLLSLSTLKNSTSSENGREILMMVDKFTMGGPERLFFEGQSVGEFKGVQSHFWGQ